MTTITKVAAEEKSELGECPVWCECKRCLYWIDIVGRTLFALDLSTSDVRSWLLPEQVGSFALTNNDDVLLLGLASRLAMFNLVDRSITTIAPSPGNHGTRIGDGCCDREGNFVFGTMDEAEQPRKIVAFYRLNAASLRPEH
ncbi:SMP-30/gluconolactonase/LRE family protein [Variovorax sp. GB1R11]|uniref:SMP-30/gluconolactonase/LRE family protein n=1 Tax=Variovorax sp. GB1R11 TaxID=3443741 RepID=UPI003F45A580